MASCLSSHSNHVKSQHRKLACPNRADEVLPYGNVRARAAPEHALQSVGWMGRGLPGQPTHMVLKLLTPIRALTNPPALTCAKPLPLFRIGACPCCTAHHCLFYTTPYICCLVSRSDLTLPKHRVQNKCTSVRSYMLYSEVSALASMKFASPQKGQQRKYQSMDRRLSNRISHSTVFARKCVIKSWQC